MQPNFDDADLIVGERRHQQCGRAPRTPGSFRPSIQRRAKQIHLARYGKAVRRVLVHFSRKTAHGWIWAHAYRFEQNISTFIVECSEATWRGLGLEYASTDEGIRDLRAPLRPLSGR